MTKMQNAVRALVVLLAVGLAGLGLAGPSAASTSSSGHLSAPAAAVTAAASTPIPAYCVDGTMNDGLIEYLYTGSSDGFNSYNYRVLSTGQAGSTSCADDPYVNYGDLSPAGCFASGTMVVLGAVMAGAGTVVSITNFAVGCAWSFVF